MKVGGGVMGGIFTEKARNEGKKGEKIIIFQLQSAWSPWWPWHILYIIFLLLLKVFAMWPPFCHRLCPLNP